VDHFDVSVIVPTVLRPELGRALASTRRDQVAIEVVVVVDRDVPRSDVRPASELADQIIVTGGGRGGAFARNLGTAAARGRWIAFLDDDDEFLPGKVTAQAAACERLTRAGRRPLVSCRAVHRWITHERVSRPVPSRLYRDGEPLDDYLFRRRRLGVDRAAVFASSLMVEASLAREVGWDETLRRHQDWDFLMRALDVPGAALHQLPLTGIVSWFGSAGSMSAGADWASSLEWARRWKGRWSNAAYVDFLTAQTLRYAVQARSKKGLLEVARELTDARRMPSASAMALGLSGVIPRGRLEAGAAALSAPVRVNSS